MLRLVQAWSAPEIIAPRQRAALFSNALGVLVYLVIALAATFLSEHYGGLQLLYALLFGLAFYFVIGNPQVKLGIDFCDFTGLVLSARVLPSRSDALAVLASIPFDASLEVPRN